METRATEIPGHAPHAPPVDPYPHHLYYAAYQQHSPNPNPNPNPNLSAYVPIESLKAHGTSQTGLDQGLRPPGVDLAASSSSLAKSHGAAYDPGVGYAHHAPGLAINGSAYYPDPNAVSALHNWTEEMLRYYGNPNATGATVSSNGTQPLGHPHANAQLWNNTLVRPHGNGTWKRTLPQKKIKTKIVQSAWCEVCRIECNSKDILDQHKTGKKHQKNMEKLNQPIAPPRVASLGTSVTPVIGPQENPDKGKAVRKKAAEPAEDLETKKRKILEGGAAAGAIRLCTICNVACNSELVFAYHMAGKKHAAMMKKHGGCAAAT